MDNTRTMARELEIIAEGDVARALRELSSDLADLVAGGDMTEAEANEWLLAKQEQWKNGL